MFLRSSIRDLNSEGKLDQSSNDPFMDNKDHTLREIVTNKHGATELEIATKAGQIFECNYDPTTKITVISNPPPK